MATKKRKNKRKERKAKTLIFVLGITAIVFVVATYAWFVGISQVKVNSFNVNIKSSDGLFLSLNGEKWTTTLSLGESLEDVLANVLNNEAPGEGESYASASLAYAGNTNSWLGITTADPSAEENDITPVSTDGTMDQENSVLSLYSKTSMSTSPGGYTLRADPITRTDKDGNPIPEDPGYVAFDLFIKNKVTGGTYVADYNELNDELIYLTKDSKVELAASSSTAGGEGLQNSLRIAFMQIARVEDGTEIATITGMQCDNDDENITGLCNKYGEVENGSVAPGSLAGDAVSSNGKTFAIWEPNDKKHTAESIGRLSQQCKTRCTSTSDEGCTDKEVGDYTTTSCSAIADNTYYKTYVVNKQILSSDKVDIYDGHNNYTATIGNGQSLREMDYYTDTEIADENRDQLFGLSASSITKIRVYIYLEGQDIDNFDITSTDQAFKIEFGFTKDRFEVLTTHVEPEPEPEP